jgi:hypothetical protein
MKKIIFPLSILAIMCLIACGPTAKELEEKRIADSIRVADSLAMAQAEYQRVSDSLSAMGAGYHQTTSSPNNVSSDDANIALESQPFSIILINQKLGYGGLTFKYSITNKLSSTFSDLDIANCLHVVYSNGEVEDKCAQWDNSNAWHFKNVKSQESIINKGSIYLICDLERTPKEVDLFFTFDAFSIDKELKDDTIAAYDLLPEWKEAQKKAGLR